MVREIIRMNEETRSISPLASQNRFWYVPDVLLIGFLVIPINVLPVLDYVAGLHNDSGGAFGVTWYLVMLALPILLGLLVLIFRVAVSWPVHIQSYERLWGLGLLTIVGVIIFLVLPFVVLGSGTFDRGFTRYVRNNVNVPAIRVWLSALDPNQYADGYGNTKAKSFAESEQPPCIASLHPRVAKVQRDAKGRLSVRLFWGSGVMGHWGVEVGDESMGPPPASASQRYQFVAPGAWIWYED